ncbi:MAG TPA: hypothetical protein PKE00_07235 [Planctomycetota bacterium]|nr:hypothetical protein [Planctomycetota bacterium]
MTKKADQSYFEEDLATSAEGRTARFASFRFGLIWAEILGRRARLCIDKVLHGTPGYGVSAVRPV